MVSELALTEQSYPLSRYSPVSLQSNENTHPVWPERLATCSPEDTSYSAITLESPAAANSLPPGEKAIARTGLTRPCDKLAVLIVSYYHASIPGREWKSLPVSLLKMYTPPFSWPEAVNLPSTDFG